MTQSKMRQLVVGWQQIFLFFLFRQPGRSPVTIVHSKKETAAAFHPEVRSLLSIEEPWAYGGCRQLRAQEI
jgi:hypothetical protein